VPLKVSEERRHSLANAVNVTPHGTDPRPFPSYAASIALSPDGKLLAIGSAHDAISQGELGEPVRVYEVSKLSPNPVADAARARSRWEGKGWHEYLKNGQLQRNTTLVTFVVTERTGDDFKGELTAGAGSLEIAGTIDRDGTIKWEVKRIIEGEKFSKDVVGGLTGSGDVKGTKLSLDWSLKGTSQRGAMKLELKE
jgi:hypothetical protein